MLSYKQVQRERKHLLFSCKRHWTYIVRKVRTHLNLELEQELPYYEMTYEREQ
jgi:hypothetical protein